MSKLSLLLALVAVAGCASAAANTRATTPYDVAHVQTHVEISPTDSANLQLGESGHATVVPVPLDRAWAGLVGTFPALALDVTQTDVVGHALAGQRSRSRRAFGGHSFAELMNCGETAGVPNAGRWDVTMQVATKLVPRGRDSTIVATWVLASAKPNATAGEQADCVPNEKVAAIVAQMVEQEAAESSKGPAQ